MARVDSLLDHMRRYGASGVVVTSNAPLRFRFPTGERHANQKTLHQDVVDLIQEIATPNIESSLLVGEPTHFEHTYRGETFRISISPRPDDWTVVVEPASKAPREPSSAPKPTRRQPRAEARPRSPEPRRDSRREAPPRGQAAAPPEGRDMESLLRVMVQRGASDLHLKSDAPPYIRSHGEMVRLDSMEPYSPEELQNVLDAIMPERFRAEFAERNDTDFAYEIPGVSRFRVNILRDRYGPGAVVRAIPFEILTPEQLGLSEEVLKLCFLTKGLVLVTGPTGSGKSTTLATMVDHINKNRSDHLITIEDPIEFIHQNKRCLVTQREVHQHTDSFRNALRAALREDPDIVLVGEMRDLETIAIAVETAETGHLVFGTLHTTTAPSTVDRIIDQFPADRQEQIRQMVSESLRGVIAQNLCKKIGGGRVAAFEVLIGGPAVSNLIREKKTYQLGSVMQTGRRLGMVTMNDSLLELVRKEVISPTEAYVKAPDKQAFERVLNGAGFTLDGAPSS